MDEEGFYEAYLPPGRFHTVYGSSFIGKRLAQLVDVLSVRQSDEVDFAVDLGLQVGGQLTLPDGQLQRGVEVHVQSQQAGGRYVGSYPARGHLSTVSKTRTLRGCDL